MKKVIEDLASKLKLITGYSGVSRIMYIKGEKAKEFIVNVHKLYPNLAFELKISKDIQEVTVDKKSITVIDVNPFTKEIKTVHEFEANEETVKKEKNKPTPEEVDLYLLSNPIDRKAKGPYNAAAEHFNVKPDYIRGRWARLRERKLVEQEIINS